MYNTYTNTYTVIDIRKTFERFQADFRMIARRTSKMDMDEVDDIIYDIIILAENKYLKTVDIVLLDENDVPIKATKFKVNENGTASSGDRPGKNNDWSNIYNSYLSIILSYTDKWKNLSDSEKQKFEKHNNFKNQWVKSYIDNSFPHLSQKRGQLYASNGFELSKTTYK